MNKLLNKLQDIIEEIKKLKKQYWLNSPKNSKDADVSWAKGKEEHRRFSTWRWRKNENCHMMGGLDFQYLIKQRTLLIKSGHRAAMAGL